MKPLLEIADLRFGYGCKPILNGVTLSLGKGEILSLLGANGCGKTTLIKLILGLLRPQSGDISIDGRSVVGAPHRRIAEYFSYVPQLHHTNIAYTVMDMVLMGRIANRGCYRRFSAADRAAAESALLRLKIIELSHRSYAELSGGQRQLVLIARALAQQAPICIMDEPENGLDYGNQVKLFALLTELSRTGISFIVTTHHPEHALWSAGKVVMMTGSGTILASGAATDCITRENLFTLYDASVKIAEYEGNRFCVPVMSS